MENPKKTCLLGYRRQVGITDRTFFMVYSYEGAVFILTRFFDRYR